MSPGRRALVDHGLAAAWSLALALFLTWPMVLAPRQALLGHPGADGLKHLWTLWWMRASVWREGVLPFHTDLVNHPQGMDLFPIEPLGGLLAVAFPQVDLVLLANAMVLGNLVLTGMAAAWMGRVLSGRAIGGLVAATLLEGGAVMAFFVHLGVGELQHLWFLPLGLGTLVKARRGGAWAAFIALGGILAAAVVAGFYVGLFLALAVATLALFSLGPPRGWPRLLPRYALAAAIALAVALPFARTFATSYQLHEAPQGGLVAALFAEAGSPAVDPPSARLQPAQIMRPRPASQDPVDLAYGGGRYLGVLTLGLALAGLLRRPREGLPWLAVALLGLVLALGSHLVPAGADPTLDLAAPRLPGFYFNRLLAWVARPINFPVRFLAVTSVALAALASLAVQRWGALLAPLAVLELLLVQDLPRPWATLPPPALEGLAPLAQLHPGEGVVDLTFMIRPDAQSRATSLGAQILHQHPVNTMPIERVEFFAQDGVWAVQALPLFEAFRTASSDLPVQAAASEARATLALLASLDLRLVLVHDGGLGNGLPGAMVDLLTGLCGPPVLRGPRFGVWRVPDQAPAAAELAAWQREHQARVEQRRGQASPMGPPLR